MLQAGALADKKKSLTMQFKSSGYMNLKIHVPKTAAGRRRLMQTGEGAQVAARLGHVGRLFMANGGVRFVLQGMAACWATVEQRAYCICRISEAYLLVCCAAPTPMGIPASGAAASSATATIEGAAPFAQDKPKLPRGIR